MKKLLATLFLMVFLMGAGLVTWRLTTVRDETIEIGGTVSDVLSITVHPDGHDDVALVPPGTPEGDNSYEKTFRYNIKKTDPVGDYYLQVEITGAAVGSVTITSITPSNLQLSNTDQKVEITVSLIEGEDYSVGSLPIQFLFTAVEGLAPSSENKNDNQDPIENESSLNEENEYIETFINVPTDNSTSYNTRIWTGIEDIEFTAKHSRTSITGYTIEDGGLMFDGSKIDPELTATIENGISSFSVDILMGFTGGTPQDRTITVFINNIEVGSHTLETNTVENLTIENINISGTFDLKITFTSRQIVINNLKWTTFSE